MLYLLGWQFAATARLRIDAPASEEMPKGVQGVFRLAFFDDVLAMIGSKPRSILRSAQCAPYLWEKQSRSTGISVSIPSGQGPWPRDLAEFLELLGCLGRSPGISDHYSITSSAIVIRPMTA
jgi:hypothetical protein